ncbi:MAG: PQQ-binding-like beta-propeller repeat protein [Deltaproteobacteria bacterium]|nr:PQQ-binding-like beta-propeller repeat protein [Deltaproteobacteria bacterium]
MASSRLGMVGEVVFGFDSSGGWLHSAVAAVGGSRHVRGMGLSKLVWWVAAVGGFALFGCEAPSSQQPRHPDALLPAAPAPPSRPDGGGAGLAAVPAGPPASAWSGGYAKPTAAAQDDGMMSRAATTATGIVAGGTDRLTSFKIGDGGTIERASIPTAAPLPPGRLIHEAGLLHVTSPGQVAAINVGTGATAWRLPVPPQRPQLHGVVATGSAVVLVVSEWQSSLREPIAVAVDRADGRQLWSERVSDYLWAMAADETHFYGLSPQGVVTARRATTGAPAWSRDIGRPAGRSSDRLAIAAGAGRVIVDVPGRPLTFLDAQSGAVTFRLPQPEDVQALASRDGRMFFATQEDPRNTPSGTGEIALSARELGSGAVAWRTPLTRTAMYGRNVLAFGRTTLYGCAPVGRLFALDVQTGRLLWQYRLGDCANILLSVASDRQPEALLVRRHDGELLAFAPTPSTLLEPLRIVVEGGLRVRGKRAPAGHKVVVGEVITETDARGRYRMEVSGRGKIVVSALPPTRANYHGTPVRLPIEGPSPRRVDLGTEPVLDIF